MSIATENPVNLDQAINTEYQTHEKKIPPEHAVLVKCLHPPSAVPGFEGLPTNDARSQALLEWRGIQIQEAPVAYKNGRYQLIGPDANMAMLVLNSPHVQAITYQYDGNLWVQDVRNIVLNKNYDFKRFSEDINLYRPVYKSMTSYLNATMFNNTGMVTSCQFNPNILFAGTLQFLAESQPHMFVRFVRDTVKVPRKRTKTAPVNIKVAPPQPKKDELDSDSDIEVISSSLHRTVITKRSKWSRSTAHLLQLELDLDIDGIDLDPNTTIQVVNFNGMAIDSPDPASEAVPTASAIMQNSTRSYGGKALDGQFVVQRLNTVSPRWLTGGNTIQNDDNTGLYSCYYYNEEPLTGAPHFVGFQGENIVGASTPKPLYDTLWSSDMTWAWIRYDGLSFNTQAQGDPSQIIINKWYVGIEAQPSMTSPYNCVSRLGPKPDLTVMQAMCVKFYDLKDAFPASFNALGAVFAGLAKGALKGALGGILGGGEKKDEETKVQKAMKETIAMERKMQATTPDTLVRTPLTPSPEAVNAALHVNRTNNTAPRAHQPQRRRSRRRSQPPENRGRPHSNSRGGGRRRNNSRPRRNSRNGRNAPRRYRRRNY